MKKRLLSSLLVVCMVLTLLPLNVFAAGETPTFNVAEGAITIEDAAGEPTKLKVSYGAGLSQTVNRADAIILTGTAGSAEAGGSTENLITVKCTGSVNITLSGVTLYGLTPFAIQSGATVNLTLTGANLLHSSAYGRGAGLFVNEGASLIIDGSGSLDAKGYYGGAGIGGGTGGSRDITTNSGSITIKGGTVKAEAFAGGAGIGSGIFITGSAAEIYGTCGTICIEGGAVTATGTTSTTGNFFNGIFNGRSGAGIGGCDEGNSGTIQISGGTVVATGAAYSAGIGGGFNGSGGVTTISGGTVTATGGDGAAGIGTGCDTDADGSDSLTCGTITLSGGVVNAKGGTGDTMSIGNGNKYTGALTSEGAITITGYPTINTYGVAMTRPIPTGATAITASVTLNDGRIAKDSEEAYTVSIGQTQFAPVTAKATDYSVLINIPVSYTTLTGEQTLTVTDTKGHSWTQQVTIADKVEVTFGEPLHKATLWFYDSSITADISPVTVAVTQNGEQLNATDTAQMVTLAADNAITMENSGVGKLVLYLPENSLATAITVTAAALNNKAPMTKENQSITAATNNITMLDTGSTVLTDTLDLAYGNITFTEGTDGKVQITYTSSEGASAITKGGLSWREHYRVVQTGAETATNNQLIIRNTGDNTARITLAGVNMTNSIGKSCIELAKAKAELTLEGANTLVSAENNAKSAALHVAEDSSVWIDGAGSLDATTYFYGAAIGGNERDNGGTITIRGGTINATTSSKASAIGSGSEGGCGNITISGGMVNATTSSQYTTAGAAIGSGNSGDCGSITISGGVVNATTSSKASAIGKGGKGNDATTCGKITIQGGDVTVSTSNSGAGLGGADVTILITGGILKATSTAGGAAIGSSRMDPCGSITISGGKVSATASFHGAAIGGGHSGSGGNITISGGTIRASSTSTLSPAIGGGMGGTTGTTTVTGGSVYVSNKKEGLASQSTFTTDGTTLAYQTLVDLTTVYGSNAAVTTPVLGSYGFHDVFTDDVGTIYLYLPEKNGTTATFDGINYTGNVEAKDGNQLIHIVSLTLGTVGGITQTSATVPVTVDADATVYYAALPTIPTTAADLVKAAGADRKKVTKGVQTNVLLSNLTSNVNYLYCFVAELSDGSYSAVQSVTFTTLKPALAGTVVLNNPAPKYGDTLTVDTTGITTDAGALSYKWYRDNEVIGGAAAASYPLTADDVGKAIKCAVSAASYSGTLETVPTAAVMVNIEAPKTAGTVQTGDAVTADKTAAKVGETVTYTVTFADGSTPTLALTGHKGTLSAPAKASGKWTYTYTVAAGEPPRPSPPRRSAALPTRTA